MKKIFLFLVLVVFFFGCFEQPQTPGTTPLGECTDLCKSTLNNGADFSSGPCLANPLKKNLGYVCDIAHNPREAVDDLQENQCSFFREGKAKHFVELDEECGLIKEY